MTSQPPSRLSITTAEQDFAGPGRHVDLFRNQGVHVKFDNGWVLSIQWSPFHYSSNRDLMADPDFRYDSPSPDATEAEVAAWKGEDGAMIALGGDTVAGWVPAADVMAALEAAAKDDEEGIREALTRSQVDV